MTTENENTTKSTKPAFIAYTVKNRDGQSDGYWTKIGVAFAHADGKGMSLLLDAIPTDGKVSLREPVEKVKTE